MKRILSGLLCVSSAIVLVLIGMFFLGSSSPVAETTIKKSATGLGTPAALPLPGTLPLVDYEKKLYAWIIKREYAKLGWAEDKEVRDTGPYLNGQYYGTHLSVYIYYSPEVMSWLLNDRKGEIPDGAMIIKEMFSPPAATYNELSQMMSAADYKALQPKLIHSWTVMVRNKQASSDGWFWASVSPPAENQTIAAAIKAQLDTRKNGDSANAQLRNSGFGLPCIRCHASAESELTFSSLKNIDGHSTEEDPVRFLTDNSWRTVSHFKDYPLSILKKDGKLPVQFNLPNGQLPWSVQTHIKDKSSEPSYVEHDRENTAGVLPSKPRYVNKIFIKTFPEIAPFPEAQVKKFPKQWLDHVVQKSGKPQEFITSDNCIGCHGGLAGDNYPVTMFVKTGPKYGDGYDVSEYGEWRWSPMGLAGRDPIFHAQLESEMALLARDARTPNSGLKGPLLENKQAVTNTCLSCHGAMGQRQLLADAEKDSSLDKNFKEEYFYLTEQLSSKEPVTKQQEKYHEYGELGREGISCMICHHIAEPTEQQVQNWQPTDPDWLNSKTPKELAYLLYHNNTGRFESTPNDVIHGPYDVKEKPMENALGITPEKNDFIKNSQLCGTCHTINLPNIGLDENEFPVLTSAETNPAFKDYNHTIEQATFLEWQNSSFASAEGGASCQDCHMRGDFETLDDSIKIDQLVSQIATIEDRFYPEVDNDLRDEDIDVVLRKDYKRHTHVGLNAFLLEMFKQFENVLGVSQKSVMTSASNKGVDLALESMALQAANETVDMAVDIISTHNQTLTAKVTTTNKTGHRFPSGVAFRRGFIEFVVKDGDDIVWSSGRTNAAGVIIDNHGKPLVTEFLPNKDTYQRHHQVITSDKQVQIYEELNQDKDLNFTTSFVHRVHDVKDNRLLPKGWRASTFFKPQGEVMTQFMAATDPKNVGDDPNYKDQGPDFKGQDSLVYRIKIPKEHVGKPLSVQATMYFQAIPPYWLKQRFSLAPKGEATRRLYYLTSHLDLRGTPMADWKFRLSSAKANVKIK